MNKMIQKTTAYERILHWSVALSCIVLLLTGLGFLYQKELGWLNTISGGVHMAHSIHNWGGIIFLASLILALGKWLPESLKWSREDSEWLGMMGGYLSKEKHPPPQGKINAGQKIATLMFIIFGLLIGVSGVLMWLMPAAKSSMNLFHLLHSISAFVYALLVPTHIYMATAANPGTFRIMTRGDVPLYWAKKKHPKWVKEIGAE